MEGNVFIHHPRPTIGELIDRFCQNDGGGDVVEGPFPADTHMSQDGTSFGSCNHSKDPFKCEGSGLMESYQDIALISTQEKVTWVLVKVACALVYLKLKRGRRYTSKESL